MATILSTLTDIAKRQPNAPALIDDGWALSYAQLTDTVLCAAKALKDRGLCKGDRFAIWAPNCAEWIIAALAGQALGGVLVTLNTRFKSAEAMDILARSQARFLFTVNGFLDVDYVSLVDQTQLPDLQEIILLKDDASAFQGFLADGAGGDAALIVVEDSDISDIIYTSGTTGLPKGVMTTHGQNVAVFDAFTSAIGMTEQDRYLVINPFFHSFGYKAGWLSCIIRGSAIYPISVFETDEVMRRIERDKITVMPGAPTIFQSLLESPKRADFDLSSLRVATTGATTIPVDLIRRMHLDLGIDDVFSAYGLTESSGVVTLCKKGDDFETIASTCGRPLPGTELRIVNDAGEDVEQGDEGELWVRGFNVMVGYLDDAQSTSETITNDGWLKTGDIGTQDAAGYVKITDRKKDMIIVGGFNCYPAEIEKILLTHEAISDVAVLGMVDDRLGEVPQAFIVCASSSDLLSESDVIAWSRAQIANSKVPRRVSFVDVLPRNASGKVMKFLLDQ